MKAILVFIDGTICDTRSREESTSSVDFYQREKVLEDSPVQGSVECLMDLSQRYEIVYIGARPDFTRSVTEEWLKKVGYPEGELYLAESQEERLSLIDKMTGKHDFIAGIGDRWDDNELHSKVGCLSIILKEYTGKWNSVSDRIETQHRKSKVVENRIHLKGKVEGLARVCPLLLSKYGGQLWEAYLSSVLEMAENTREARRIEDLAVFARHGLDPTDLRDAAKMNDLLREENWENNSVFGLQNFELVEATKDRYVHKVTFCYYSELWKEHGRPDIGYQIHCRTDMAWWDRPAWNPKVRFEQPQTLMQGQDCCVFIQSIPKNTIT